MNHVDGPFEESSRCFYCKRIVWDRDHVEDDRLYHEECFALVKQADEENEERMLDEHMKSFLKK